MKCLLCNYNGDRIKEHCIVYHKINKNNYFFKQLFQKNNFCIERCCIIIPTSKFMIQHTFLEHYESGERKPAKYKSITVIKNKEVLIYQIDFTKHSEEYDFYNSHQIVDDFLLNVYRLFTPKNKVLFYWSSDVYSGVYFNDFIISEIRNEILKKVINNLSGSSWHFNRFKHINLKIIDHKNKIHL